MNELRVHEVDLVFNLSNGMGREASLTQVPNLLKNGKIPYTASAPLGHGISYNKIFTTKILLEHNIRSPKFLAVHQLSDIDDIALHIL
ncbi:MAG: hypothetical protein Q4Q07_01600 [Tissierellia bacterium]|nr:hypothetical protein [Tissierellia bacterium]